MSNFISDESSDDDSVDSQYSDSYLLPRDILSRTNWLCRVDVLRVHDRREMAVVWDLSVMLLDYVSALVSQCAVLLTSIRRCSAGQFQDYLKKSYDLFLVLIEWAYSEGYCYFLEYMTIAYYPSSNNYRTWVNLCRFPSLGRRTINDLSPGECRDMTGLSTNQLLKLYRHLRFPASLSWRRRYTFTSEEAFLHFMTYLRLGVTKLRLSTNYFGGDPRRFTYSI